MYVCLCTCSHMPWDTYGSQRTTCRSWFYFYLVGPGDLTQVLSLVRKHLHQVSQLANSMWIFLSYFVLHGHVFSQWLMCWLIFMPAWHRLGSFGRVEAQLRNYSYQTGLCARLWGIFLINDRYGLATRWVVFKVTRKEAEETLWSKSVNHVLPWLLASPAYFC